MATLNEGLTEWEIVINPNLKHARSEQWKKGIKRYWGFDPSDKSHKLIMVQYPKSEFSRNDMNRILPEYSSCKLCVLSTKFIKGKNNDNIMSLSIIDQLGRIPYAGRYITGNRDISERIIMQVLATISRYPLTLLTDLGKRLASLGIGVLGTGLITYYGSGQFSKSELLEYFANWISSSIEMNAGSLGLGIRSDVAKLRRAIQMGNFAGISTALVRDSTKIGSNIRASIPKLSMNFKNFSTNAKNFFSNITKGRLRLTETTIPDQRKIIPRLGTEVKEAGDYKYVGTEDRFRDISKFSQGFKDRRRLRESGTAVYESLVS